MMILTNICDKVGQTPMVKLKLDDNEKINLFVKLESFNPTGSVKDRAAEYIIKYLLQNRIIDQNTTIIESSSGNFAISLAAYCNKYGLEFMPVIDPNTLPINEFIINNLCKIVIKVTEQDEGGGYLLNRIARVKETKAQIPNSYWINQYKNILNAQAYYYTLGEEICAQVHNIDYAFIGVSSGGTITGVSRKIKEKFHNSKIIAVDSVGSVIFGGTPKKRYIPGMGSSMVPKILREAYIDHVCMVDEVKAIRMCHELLKKYNILAGGSSGAIFSAIIEYFSSVEVNEKTNVVTIFPDSGERYTNTIYNYDWCLKRFNYKEWR